VLHGSHNNVWTKTTAYKTGFLGQYVDTVFCVGDGRFDFAKASQLPTVIASEQQELVNGKQLMKKETAECTKLKMHYCEVVKLRNYEIICFICFISLFINLFIISRLLLTLAR